MKLYYFETINGQKVCAVAKYLDAPVEYVHVDLAKGEHKTPAYLAINPNGKIPALVDGDTVVVGIQCHHVPSRTQGEIRSLADRSGQADRGAEMADHGTRSISRAMPVRCISIT